MGGSDGFSKDKKVVQADYEMYSQTEHFKNAKKGEIIVTDPYEDVYTHEQCISISIPIFNGADVVGEILVDLSPKYFEVGDGIKMESFPSLFGEVMNENEVIIHSDQKAFIGKKLSETLSKEDYEKISKKLAKKVPFKVFYTYKGAGKVAFFSPVKIGKTLWWSRTGLTRKDFESQVKESILITVFGSITSIAVLLLFVLKLLAKQIKPIEKINMALAELRKGNLDMRLDQIGRAHV